MEDIYEKVTSILSDKLGIAESEMKPNACFIKDLGIDSLDYVELLMDFESEFQIRILDSEGESLKTIGGAVDYIERKINEM